MSRPALPMFLLAASLGCGGSGTLTPPETSEWTPTEAELTARVLYDSDHVVQIDITLDPDDAAALASETNNLFNLLEGADCMDSPWSGPFNWYPADIVVDGEAIGNVGVRKKGLIGSLSTTRPSLKVKFDKFVPDQTYGGMERLTLNNAVSDPALVKQCLGYALFSAAGVAAPRCNFAHVTANGDDLGVYVNVEPLKKDFLAAAYDGDNDGDLYEGTLSDFRPGWTDTFEPETSDTDPGLGPVLAVTDALQEPDAAVLPALDEVLDVDLFYRFWAMEVLVGHVDGYAGNRNNFYVYRPERTDRLEFLPWGIDAIFRPGAGFSGGEAVPVFAGSALPRRLWELDESRDAYLATLEAVTDEVWDEDWLLDEIDRMDALVSPFALPEQRAPEELDRIRGFVQTRAADLLATVDEPLPEFDEPLPDEVCLVEAGDLLVEFDTTWETLGTEDPLNTGWSSADGVLDGVPIEFEGSAIAGWDGQQVVIGAIEQTGPTVITEAIAFVPPWAFEQHPVPLGGFGARVYLIEIDFAGGQGNEEVTILGSIWNGWLTLEALEPEPGGPVIGRFEGPLYNGGP